MNFPNPLLHSLTALITCRRLENGTDFSIHHPLHPWRWLFLFKLGSRLGNLWVPQYESKIAICYMPPLSLQEVSPLSILSSDLPPIPSPRHYSLKPPHVHSPLHSHPIYFCSFHHFVPSPTFFLSPFYPPPLFHRFVLKSPQSAVVIPFFLTLLRSLGEMPLLELLGKC